ncbi:cysteine hydrolase [Roseomonas sp. NAR14]|uniref:Cysteine hydrolase n=1 Tax=Roseomonas acroporae TaxID=2937791 RepID=A0A9X1YC90_9PROT|nr:isochorismatase family cysteine hydrolase [Roseomonas acroporae]MCK8787102.1 cysteine hydrolase [Roseomonas acroporae]
MHPFTMPPEIVARVVARCGREHPFDVLDPARTALVVIDMQNYFVAPGYLGEVPMARAVVPAINRLAAALRERGGHVAWVCNTTTDTADWSVLHEGLLSPAVRDRRRETMERDHPGHALYPALEVGPGDAHLAKNRFSAFIQGASAIEPHLRQRGIDTVLVAGTATNVCCESTARDAMMLNFRTLMISDALASFTDAEHAAALTGFYAIFGDVQTVDEAVASLDRGLARRAA